jgi:hypothetical protein
MNTVSNYFHCLCALIDRQSHRNIVGGSVTAWQFIVKKEKKGEIRRKNWGGGRLARRRVSFIDVFGDQDS